MLYGRSEKHLLRRMIMMKKREMYQLADEYGMVDPRVVNVSQKLDELLNEYQSL